VEVLRDRDPSTGAAGAMLLATSYAFLFEFGRRLTRASAHPFGPGRWLVRGMSPWIFTVPVLGLALGAAVDRSAGLSAAARYFVGFPGALLAAAGLLSCMRAEAEGVGRRRLLVPFGSAAAAFLFYGVLGGLIANRSALFPAGFLNETTFLAVVGLRVQVLRATCAALVLITMATILRVYHAEVRRRLRTALENAQTSLSILRNLPEGIAIADEHGRIESVNPAFENSTGYRFDEIAGQNARVLRSTHHDQRFYHRIGAALRDTGRWQGEIWLRRKNGEIHPEWLRISALRDTRGRVGHYLAVLSDVETHREVKQRLHRLAYYDALTGLPNRLLFRDRLELTLAQARRAHHGVALMFVDLDRFKRVNDTQGHSRGDRILQAVAERITGAVRDSDTVARVGGDEFTVIVPGLASPLGATRVARKILAALDLPFALEQREFFISASIGIAMYPGDGQDLESLTRKADIAMYCAKELGRNNYRMYTRQMSTHVHRRVVLENELRRAVERGQMYVLYQPQIDLRSGEMVGVEALARWRHPTLGNVPPTTFIAIAEESGMIDTIGEWVLATACRETAAWATAWPRPPRVAVNLSARQLRRREFADRVARILKRSGMLPEGLSLELTESVMAQHSTSRGNALEVLGSMGVQITIDDFGTGYCSLSYLKRFSVDKLKIDRSFIRDLPSNPNDRALASMIIAMAHASGMRVTAEGVETDGQMNFLRSQGCDEVQGFLLSEPVPAASVALMTGFSPPPPFREPGSRGRA
jgi:diguanylate cyclase (GGDEF)-like protein/PAS domain S-box-containing protein